MENPLPRDARNLAAAITRAARTIPNRALQEVPTHHGVILQMFWRCSPLFDGVIALLERGLPEEALFLGRSLFDESLQLQELADASEAERIGLVLGREKHSIMRNRHLMEVAIKVGLEKKLTAAEAGRVLQDRERKVDGYAARHRTQPKSFMKPLHAAKRLGRTEDYWTRELAHHMVHGNDAAMVYRRSKPTPGTLLVTNRTIKPRLVVGAMCFAGRSLLYATAAADKIFAWDGEAQLKALFERVAVLEPGN